MCGYIAGPRKVLEDIGVNNLLLKQIHRGTDGYGAVAIYDKGNSKSLKSMAKASVIDWITALEGNPFVILHHRATSVGGTKLALAHPLKYNETILMQNGTNKDPYNMVEEAESDSEALCMLADSMSPEDFSTYILDDVGVVVYRKNAKFYLHKDKTRPLVEHDSGLLCSEPLIEGNWKKVKEGFYSINAKKGNLVGLDYEKPILVDDVGTVKYCTTCKKRHLTPSGFAVCNTCVTSGIAQKKEFTRGTTNNGNVNYGRDYDEYENEWPYQKKQSKYGNRRTSTVHTLITPNVVKPEEVKKVTGIPITIDGDFYIVPGNSLDDTADFYVAEKELAVDDARFYRGGYIPTCSGEPEELTIYDFLPYWIEADQVYDLITDVYYEIPTALMPADMEILVFDKYMEAYILPLSYNYMPDTYLLDCSEC